MRFAAGKVLMLTIIIGMMSISLVSDAMAQEEIDETVRKAAMEALEAIGKGE